MLKYYYMLGINNKYKFLKHNLLVVNLLNGNYSEGIKIL
jgi:hypothetical protein